MEKILPKKSLGQNFLVDKNISRKIIDSLDIQSNDVIIEIGCGTGALTELLLNSKPDFLVSYDIDQRAIDSVKKLLASSKYKNFEVIHSDIRSVQISDIVKKYNSNSKKVKVIGNIPYNISGDIFFWIFEQCSFVEKSVIMIQKEVAQRLTAKPKTKSYGITTVALNLIGNCRLLFDVSPKCFYPVPKVTSTVVEIVPNDKKYSKINFKEIMILVKMAFNQRRKILRNALKEYINEKIGNEQIETLTESISHYLTQRAEQLTVNDFIQLYNVLNESKK